MVPSIISLLFHEDEKVALSAMRLLVVIRSQRDEVCNCLLKLAADPMRSDTVRSNAAIALLFVSPEGSSVSKAIFGPRNAPMRPAITAANKDVELSEEAQQVRLRDIGLTVLMISRAYRAAGRTTEEVSALVELTSVRFDSDTRVMATLLLGELEEDAHSALPRLWGMLGDKDTLVRRCAGYAIVKIDPDVDPRAIADRAALEGTQRRDVVAALQLSMEAREHERTMRRRAIDDVLSEAIAKLEHGRPAHRREALRVLTELGEAAKPAIATVRRCVQDCRDRICRELAIELLEQLE
ncbi:MAG: hypothetical protein RIC55_30725 [Pirellulaceae bacterium]